MSGECRRWLAEQPAQEGEAVDGDGVLEAASGRQTDAAVAIVSFSAVNDSITTGPS